MVDNAVLMVMAIVAFFSSLEVLGGYLQHSIRSKDDWIQEVLSAVLLSVVFKPCIVGGVVITGTILLPEYQVLWSNWVFGYLCLLYLMVDDIMQYFYHRYAHRHPFFWKLHRPHHQAEEMGFFVSYRNAALYYWLMPNAWWLGVFTFLFGGAAAALGLVLKQVIVISSHSHFAWDKLFYINPWLRPIIKILERIIVTPAFHHAHHGQSQLDGSDPNANFGNMFSIWDQLFGTAHFTHHFPSAYGLPNNSEDSWQSAYLYPLIHSKDPKSEISITFNKKNTSTNTPIFLDLKQGDSYLWCRCGKSKTQPFCDASHHGTQYKPVLFEVQKDASILICNCKYTKSAPFCDNSHLQIKEIK